VSSAKWIIIAFLSQPANFHPVSAFATTLDSLMEIEILNQDQLSRASGVDRTTISRILRDERSPTREILGRLVAAISTDRERRLELLFAHLRDEAAACIGAGITDSHFVLQSRQPTGESGGLGADLELIAREAARHDDVRETIVDLARMLRRHAAEVLDAAGTVYPFSDDTFAAATAEAPPPAPKKTTSPRRPPGADGPVPKPPAAG
jgi:transcriptional regulator with XRE-family HTH domain